jgi:3-hydroxyisobutyryl-CoA hydrolase
VLVTKTRTRPEWAPSNLEDVTTELLERFFSKQSEYLQGLPKLEVPKEFEALSDNKHLKYALPTEAEIGAYVRGSHVSSGDFGCTAEDVKSFFEKARSGKVGVREKVAEVIERKCEVIDNADGNFVWLRWID